MTPEDIDKLVRIVETGSPLQQLKAAALLLSLENKNAGPPTEMTTRELRARIKQLRKTSKPA